MKFGTERHLRYLISPGDASPTTFSVFKDHFLTTIRLAIEARISLIQVREKRITARQLFELASAAAALTNNTSTKLLINERADVAIAAGADGVHLPESGVPVSAIRAVFPSLIIGRSVHTSETAVQAESDGADLLLFGPVFDSGEKKGVGLEQLSNVCAAVIETPVIAVGGIDAAKADAVLDAGAAGYASIRYLNDHAVLKALR